MSAHVSDDGCDAAPNMSAANVRVLSGRRDPTVASCRPSQAVNWPLAGGGAAGRAADTGAETTDHQDLMR